MAVLLNNAVAITFMCISQQDDSPELILLEDQLIAKVIEESKAEERFVSCGLCYCVINSRHLP